MARKFFVGGNWKMYVNPYPAMNNPAIAVPGGRDAILQSYIPFTLCLS